MFHKKISKLYNINKFMQNNIIHCLGIYINISLQIYTETESINKYKGIKVRNTKFRRVKYGLEKGYIWGGASQETLVYWCKL